MAGHNKWSKVKHIKARVDAIKGRVFSKCAHEIARAARAGGGDPSKAKLFKDVPVWAFHGDADPVVPVRTTRDMIAALEKAGGKPKATYYPGVQHDSWTQTYADIEVLKWMFAQRNKGSVLAR